MPTLTPRTFRWTFQTTTSMARQPNSNIHASTSGTCHSDVNAVNKNTLSTRSTRVVRRLQWSAAHLSLLPKWGPGFIGQGRALSGLKHPDKALVCHSRIFEARIEGSGDHCLVMPTETSASLTVQTCPNGASTGKNASGTSEIARSPRSLG